MKGSEIVDVISRTPSAHVLLIFEGFGAQKSPPLAGVLVVSVGTTALPIAGLTRTGNAEVFIGETRLRTRPDPALNFRHWVCPVCDRSCRHLYCIGGRWMCRICGRLDYASRHCFRSLPGYHRARWLRRRLQLPLQLFSPLPDYPRHHTRKRRLVAELRLLEAGLARHLQGINDTLDKRRAVGKRWPG